MAQIDHQAHGIATENIAQFQEPTESDTCQRKLLNGLLVLERPMTIMISGYGNLVVMAAQEKS